MSEVDLRTIELGELIILTYHPKKQRDNPEFTPKLILNITIGYYTPFDGADFIYQGFWTYQPWYGNSKDIETARYFAEDISYIMAIKLNEVPAIIDQLNDSSLIKDWISSLKLETLLTNKNKVLREFAKQQIERNGLIECSI